MSTIQTCFPEEKVLQNLLRSKKDLKEVRGKKHLIQVLKDVASADIIVGTFSAASNVTGFMTDVNGVTRILKTYSAIAIWDYGCGAPYMSMRMKSDCNDSKDSIIFSLTNFSVNRE